MKQRLLLAFCLLSISLQAQNWSMLPDFSGSSRDDGCAFVIDGVAYCGTGRDAGFAYTSDFHSFSFGSESWFPVSSLPDSAKRQYASAVSLNGAGYLFGGFNQNGFLNDLWKYDPTADLWTLESQAPFPGRSGHQSFVIGDTIYIAGGRSEGFLALTEVWAYRTDLQQWDQKASLPGDGVWRGFGVENDSVAIVGLGADSMNVKRGEIYSYNPSMDTWTEITGLQTEPLTYPNAQRIESRLFVFGGEDTFGNYSNAFRYIDLTDNTWHNLTDFPDVPRRGSMSFVSSTDFYISTGITTTERLDQTWVARSAVGLEPLYWSSLEAPPYKSGNFLIANAKWNSCIMQTLSGKKILLNRVAVGKFELPENITPGIYFFQKVNEPCSRVYRLPILEN